MFLKKNVECNFDYAKSKCPSELGGGQSIECHYQSEIDNAPLMNRTPGLHFTSRHMSLQE
jgi:hypothetical protein